MVSSASRRSFLAVAAALGLAFAAGYWVTADSRAASVEVSDEESATLVGGGGYTSTPFNCAFCSVGCIFYCPTTILLSQTADAEAGNDQRVVTGLVPCGGAGWIYNCSSCLGAPPPACNR